MAMIGQLKVTGMLMANSSFMGNKIPRVTIQDVYQDKYDLSFGNITFPFSISPLILVTFNDPIKITVMLMIKSNLTRQTGPIIAIKYVSQIIC